MLGLPITAVHAATTTSACAAIANGGRPPRRHGFGLYGYCPSRPSARPPRLRPVRGFPVGAVCATTTTLACAAIADHGRLGDHPGFGLLGEGQSDCELAADTVADMPTAQPPRLRPVPLLITAGRSTATASVCAATGRVGRRCQRSCGRQEPTNGPSNSMWSRCWRRGRGRGGLGVACVT